MTTIAGISVVDINLPEPITDFAADLNRTTQLASMSGQSAKHAWEELKEHYIDPDVGPTLHDGYQRPASEAQGLAYAGSAAAGALEILAETYEALLRRRKTLVADLEHLQTQAHPDPARKQELQDRATGLAAEKQEADALCIVSLGSIASPSGAKRTGGKEAGYYPGIEKDAQRSRDRLSKSPSKSQNEPTPRKIPETPGQGAAQKDPAQWAFFIVKNFLKWAIPVSKFILQFDSPASKLSRSLRNEGAFRQWEQVLVSATQGKTYFSQPELRTLEILSKKGLISFPGSGLASPVPPSVAEWVQRRVPAGEGKTYVTFNPSDARDSILKTASPDAMRSAAKGFARLSGVLVPLAFASDYYDQYKKERGPETRRHYRAFAYASMITGVSSLEASAGALVGGSAGIVAGPFGLAAGAALGEVVVTAAGSPKATEFATQHKDEVGDFLDEHFRDYGRYNSEPVAPIGR